MPHRSVLIFLLCDTPLQTQGTLLESMDALFIGRKKSAGRSVRNPLFGTVLFDDDTEVEEFVQQHPTTSRANGVCGNLFSLAELHVFET